MVIGAGAGWQSTVPAAAARLTVASVDGSDAIASVTAPSRLLNFDNRQERSLRT